jgi:xanthine dehydrogenase YagS FAD-binding subunit
VAPIPWIPPEAEKALAGKSVSEETARAAAEVALERATPLSQNSYKVQLARVAVRRAIMKAGGVA